MGRLRLRLGRLLKIKYNYAPVVKMVNASDLSSDDFVS